MDDSAGIASVSISRCYNMGAVNAGTAGGIIGMFSVDDPASSLEIEDCYNTGALETVGASNGGIVGSVTRGGGGAGGLPLGVGPRSSVGGPDPVGGIYVSTNGNDVTANGSIALPYKSINAALDAAPAGVTIILRGGTYQEHDSVRIRQPNITIKSAQGEWAVIDLPLAHDPDPGHESSAVRFDPGASGGTLQGIEVIGGFYAVVMETEWDWTLPPDPPGPGVCNITIEDCVLHDSRDDVVKVKPNCDDITIRYNKIYNSGREFLTDERFITGQCNSEGIDNVNGDRMHVHNNHIHDICSTAVYAKGGAVDALIESNLIERAYAAGIMVGFDTTPNYFDTTVNPGYYENIGGIVRNNLIIDTGWEGIGLYASMNAQVYNNTVVNAVTYGTGNFHTPIYFGTANQDWENTGGCPPNVNPAIHHNIVSQPPSYTGRMIEIRYIVDFYNPVTFPGLASYDLSGLDGMPMMGDNCYFLSAGSARFTDMRPASPLSNAGLAAWKSHISGDSGSLEVDPGLDSNFIPNNALCAGMGYSSASPSGGGNVLSITRCYNVGDIAAAATRHPVAPGYAVSLAACHYDFAKIGAPSSPPFGCTGHTTEQMTDNAALATSMASLGSAVWEKRTNALLELYYPELKIFKNNANATIAADSMESVATEKPPASNAWLLDSGLDGDTRMKHYDANSAWDGWDLAVCVTDGTVALRAATGGVTISSLANTSPTTSCALWLNHPIYVLGEETPYPLVNIEGNGAGGGGNPILGGPSNGPSTPRICDLITALHLPGTLTNIGNRAFSECANLGGNLVIPPGVVSIGVSAFDGCESLQGAVIPQGVTAIADGLFNGCWSLVSVTIPEGVTAIGNDAFHGCSCLTSVDIPGGVTSIGDSAFESCRDLESVTIPHGVVSIGDFAFYSCGNLVSVTLPASVTTLGHGVFGYSSGLTAVYMLGNAPSVGANIYDGTPPTLTTHILQGTTGWGGVPPANWQGRPTAYVSVSTLNGIPHAWLDQYYLGDPRGYETLSLINGENGIPMLDCYIADLIPTNAASLFKITHFSLTNGIPYLVWDPDKRPRRVYTVLGTETLAPPVWLPTNQVPSAAFFKVEVKLQ